MSIESYVHNGESYSFSDTDIKNMTDHKYDIYTYEDLSKYNNIDDILGKNKGAVILFQNTENSGHWVSIWLDNNTLHFFDSYGLSPDSELKYSSYNLRMHNNKEVPHLTHLIQNSGYNMMYNKYKLQKSLKDTSTCGRWVSYRLKHRNLSCSEFAALFQNNKHYDADFWITVITAHWGSFNS